MVGDALGVGVLALADRLEDVALGEDAGPGASGSSTTAAPTLRSAIAARPGAACGPGPTVSTIVLIPSRTCIRSPPPLDACNDCRNRIDLASGGRVVSANAPLLPADDPLWRARTYANVPTQRPATIRHRTSLFEDAVAIVEQEYASDLSLDDIARRVASSRRQLQRAYAEIGDTTFREHLTARAHGARRRAAGHRGLTVREVAHRVGYRQPAQFAKAFRRHHGVAPSDFRVRRAARGRSRAAPRPRRWRRPRAVARPTRVPSVRARCIGCRAAWAEERTVSRAREPHRSLPLLAIGAIASVDRHRPRAC